MEGVGGWRELYPIFFGSLEFFLTLQSPLHYLTSHQFLRSMIIIDRTLVFVAYNLSDMSTSPVCPHIQRNSLSSHCDDRGLAHRTLAHLSN